MAKKFVLFGVLGWCVEILWTGFCSFLVGDAALTAKTYLWMFPIYGAAGFVLPLFFLPALAALVSSLFLEPMFKPYMPAEEPESRQ